MLYIHFGSYFKCTCSYRCGILLNYLLCFIQTHHLAHLSRLIVKDFSLVSHTVKFYDPHFAVCIFTKAKWKLLVLSSFGAHPSCEWLISTTTKSLAIWVLACPIPAVCSIGCKKCTLLKLLCASHCKTLKVYMMHLKDSLHGQDFAPQCIYCMSGMSTEVAWWGRIQASPLYSSLSWTDANRFCWAKHLTKHASELYIAS